MKVGEWLDELERDAALGRAVREMAGGHKLIRFSNGGWAVYALAGGCRPRYGDTPEQALGIESAK